MSYKNVFIVVPLFLLTLGFLILSSPQESRSVVVPISNCCSSNLGTGCDNFTCENFVCDLDSFCCDSQWDDICADEAAQYCTVCGGEPVIIRPVPTMNQWAMIALAGIMGLSALYILLRRNPLESGK